ncbi:tripartite motif-containing protein 3-like [Anneissia japonica]|uniref:tripartite motif-containing protein 3-like n=1 Tax=Anneissia japonica TaxID=1529436 RepID=UPI0014258D49|nr:tripartite motif-containing protein 3-like [Anneissia japonica]
MLLNTHEDNDGPNNTNVFDFLQINRTISAIMSFNAATKGSLTQLVECSICYENYNETNRLPKLLPCGHTICLSCVQQISEESGRVVCASCRAVVDVPHEGCGGFPNDLTMVQAITMLRCSQTTPRTSPPPRAKQLVPLKQDNGVYVDHQLDVLRWKLTDLRCQCQLTAYSMKEIAEKCAYVRRQVKNCFIRLRKRIDKREAILLQTIEDLDSNPVQSNSQAQVHNATEFIQYVEKQMDSSFHVEQVKHLIKICGELLSRLDALYKKQMSNDRTMVFIETHFEDAIKCIDEVGSFDDSLGYVEMNVNDIPNAPQPPTLPVRSHQLSTGGAAYLGPQLTPDKPEEKASTPFVDDGQYQLLSSQNDYASSRWATENTNNNAQSNQINDDYLVPDVPPPPPTINEITIGCQSPRGMQVFNPNMFHSLHSSNFDTAKSGQEINTDQGIQHISLSAAQRSLGEKYFRHGRLFIGGPSGVAITEDQFIVVADKGNNCIRVFNEIGTHIKSFRCDRGKHPLKCPVGVATYSHNKVIVVDGYYRVHVFDWTGEHLVGFTCQHLTDSSQSRTTSLIGIAVDCRWNIYIVDSDAHCINTFDIEGVVVRRIGDASRLGKPKGLCLHGDKLFVTDKLSNNIKIFSTVDGSYIGKIGHGKGTGPGFFRSPRGIVSDRKGNIIVADYGNNRVQMFDSNGNCVRIIESRSSALREPEDVAVFRDGRMVISDGGNERLLLI